MERKDVLERFHAQIDAGRPIIGTGAGTGLSAKCAEVGGADFLVIYNSGRYRMAGRASCAGMLPFSDANAVVVDMAKEILTIVEEIPVFAGVCGTDPYRRMPRFLAELKDIGFSGVQNFPSVALIDGRFRVDLEDGGFGFEREVEMVRAARELELASATYVVTLDEARRMAEAGADVLVPHMLGTVGGMVGLSAAMSLDECVEHIQEMRDLAASINPDILVVCHGGPIATAEDLSYVLARTTGVHGYVGASSIERLPTEPAIIETVNGFKAVAIAQV